MGKNNGVTLANSSVILESANEENVEILIQWTLDPVAQGPYKVVPNMSEDELKELFLYSKDRAYFLIKDNSYEPIGRLYHRAWNFDTKSSKIDWELNIFIANPLKRGKGYGSAAQKLIVDYLLNMKESNSIFAYTMKANIPEQKSLEKIGFTRVGILPSDYYKIDLEHIEPNDFYLYVYVDKREIK